MKNIFNQVLVKKPQSSYFDLTHDVKMSGQIGELMPCCVLECMPGDKFTIGSDMLVRFAPMLAPIMHRVDVTVHYFFVPNRILWDNWERFITNQAATDGAPAPVAPNAQVFEGVADPLVWKFLDRMGIPPSENPDQTEAEVINLLPLAAYNRIYADYYRDQNLELGAPPAPFEGSKLVDGANPLTPYFTRLRAWEHDYFTSALPWAQKGPEVVIPFNQTPMPVNYNDTPAGALTTLTGTPTSVQTYSGDGSANSLLGPNQLYADPVIPNNEGAPTIDDFRLATRLKEWLEKNARGGTRYIEQLKAHFDVNSSDKRLDRPEYITGMKAPVIISEVLNTTGLNAADQPPQGTMAGHGVSVSGGKTGSYFAEEHGHIIGIASVTPKPAYQQGIPKMYSRLAPLDYPWPSFAHLGEQEIENRELYAYTTAGNQTFGYIPRYSELKYQPSRVTGDFRSSLSYWHMGRIFSAAPALNNDFIKCDPLEVNRVFAVTDTDPTQDTIFMHILHKIGVQRRLPKFGTPSL